jgi:hypothetical protein
MLRVLTFDGRNYGLRLNNKPCPILLHRMVRSRRGTVSIHHRDGIVVLRCADIKSISLEDDSTGAPWDYDDPTN